MTLTEPLIRAGMEGGIGFTKKQAVVLDVQWPLRRGWLEKLIGKQVSDAQYAFFLDLKGKRRGKKPRKETPKNHRLYRDEVNNLDREYAAIVSDGTCPFETE